MKSFSSLRAPRASQNTCDARGAFRTLDPPDVAEGSQVCNAPFSSTSIRSADLVNCMSWVTMTIV